MAEGIEQLQAWNSSYAFGSPAFHPNANNERGGSLNRGGGGHLENHVIGSGGYDRQQSGSRPLGDYTRSGPHSIDLD